MGSDEWRGSVTGSLTVILRISCEPLHGPASVPSEDKGMLFEDLGYFFGIRDCVWFESDRALIFFGFMTFVFVVGCDRRRIRK